MSSRVSSTGWRPRCTARAAGRPISSAEVELRTATSATRQPSVKRLSGVDAVIHLAAAVGVGQSMYQIADYVGVNDLGTAVLLEALAQRPVERLVVASSMSIYGEGLARAGDGTLVEPAERPLEQLKARAMGARRAGRLGARARADTRDQAAGAELGLCAEQVRSRSACA